MEIVKLVLEYLKVIIASPVVALVILVYFLNKFQDSISEFLCRIGEGE